MCPAYKPPGLENNGYHSLVHRDPVLSPSLGISCSNGGVEMHAGLLSCAERQVSLIPVAVNLVVSFAPGPLLLLSLSVSSSSACPRMFRPTFKNLQSLIMIY